MAQNLPSDSLCLFFFPSLLSEGVSSEIVTRIKAIMHQTTTEEDRVSCIKLLFIISPCSRFEDFSVSQTQPSISKILNSQRTQIFLSLEIRKPSSTNLIKSKFQ
jgi:hypothetical protein